MNEMIGPMIGTGNDEKGERMKNTRLSNQGDAKKHSSADLAQAVGSN